jgi:hypothetical protein
LLNIQDFIIPKLESKNFCEIEYLLTEFDIIEDKNNKYWLKGINWDPNFDQNELQKIVDDIFLHIKIQKFNYLLDLSLEKFVQTHFSNSSF